MEPAALKTFRDACLKNAADLHNAAGVLLEKNIDHIAFSLIVLALEEIGKVHIAMAKSSFEVAGDVESNTEDDLIDDHEKKLFWALWGVTLTSESITKDDIEQHRGLSKLLHIKKLDYLYVDPSNPEPPSDKIEKGEAQHLHELVAARLKIEDAHEIIVEGTDVDKRNLKWFLDASKDPEKRRLIFSQRSLDRLAELGNGRDWMAWLYGEFEQADAEAQKLLEKELKRIEPEKEEGERPKWKIKFRLESPSHTIRPRALGAWNKTSDWIKFYHTRENNELLAEFTFPKRVPVEGLWTPGWLLSRKIAAALCIATRGVFWWHAPKDIEQFYEEITDLENPGFGVRAARSPRLNLDWRSQRFVLKEDRMNAVAGVLGRLLKIKQSDPMTEVIESYLAGVAFLSKVDIHVRFEANAFERFYNAFRLALRLNGDWRDGEELEDAAKRKLARFLKTDEVLVAAIRLGSRLQAGNQPDREVTLTEVVGMKWYFDYYFLESVVGATIVTERDASGDEKAA